jgi:hypothetical protein
MNEIILTCCGQAIPAPPAAITCPGCGTVFAEDQVEQIRMQELEEIPVVDFLRLKQMLSQTEDYILDHRAALEAQPGSDARQPNLVFEMIFPISAVRRFATERNLLLTPRPVKNGLLWIKRPTS